MAPVDGEGVADHESDVAISIVIDEVVCSAR